MGEVGNTKLKSIGILPTDPDPGFAVQDSDSSTGGSMPYCGAKVLALEVKRDVHECDQGRHFDEGLDHGGKGRPAPARNNGQHCGERIRA